MKIVSFAILFLGILSSTYSQQIDSVKYEYGHLYYRTYGKGEIIVILSGGPGSNALQEESVALKLSENYKVILLEQRGTGLSIPTKFDSTTITLKAAISDINLLLKHLNISKTILLGHSWGGSLAMIYASQFPQKVKSLILIAPGYFGMGWPMYRLCVDNSMSRLGKQEKERLLELFSKQDSGNISVDENNEVRKLIRLPYLFDKSKYDSLMPIVWRGINEKTFQLMLYNVMEYDFSLNNELQKIKSPIHLICGRQDFFNYVAYELKIARPNINLYWIEKSGHFPMYEQPETFYPVINQIIKKSKNYR